MTQEELSLGTELGDLLLRAGLLTVQDLAEVRQTAEKWNQPFEKVLLVSKRTTEVALDNALLAMKMMAEIRLSERTALEALKFASQTGMRFEDSILRVTGVGSYDTSSDLETLLVHSELVNLSSLNEGKRISVERNIPLCNSLILIGATTFTHINYLFECLYLTRHGRIAQATAINALRIVGHRNIDLATALDMQGLVSTSTLSRIKLGDLLVAGQVVSEQALVGELERAATSSCQIGEVLLNDGLVTEQVLNDTLMLQRLCISGLIDRNKAARLLRKAICTNNDLASVIRAEELFQDEDMGTEALCLLLRCKFVDTDAVLRAKKKFVPFNMGAIKALVASNLVPLEVCNAALEVALLVTTNRVSEGDAVKVLSYCRQHKCDYMTAMKKLEVEIEISDPTLEITRVQSSEKAKV
ncbi:MAG: hypothetical protein K2Z81_16510, partial [Cyanobacteria bacterium]|nr:hypothetical protein [Cyanobacteriota bacterium]